MISRDLEISLNLAVSEAARHGHEFVTLEHMLYSLLNSENVIKVIQACGGSIKPLQRDLENFFLEHLEKEVLQPGQMPQPTAAFQRVIQRAAQQVHAAGKETIGGSNVLISIFGETDSFAAYFLEKHSVTKFDVVNFISHGVIKPGVDPTTITGLTPYVERGSTSPSVPSGTNGTKQETGEEDEEGFAGASNALATYTVDLTAKAEAGELDPVIGRDLEIERTVQILCRRRKNNPLFIGDAGVGKTALAEGLALRIAAGKVPPRLKEARIFALDMGSVLAGARFRGDFEQRLKAIVKELQEIPNSIMFIDEIHTVIGAGAVSGGAMDASNLLKPALSSGQLRCIGSTTFKEFRTHFENDHAFARRFQRIDVNEPSLEDTIKILKGIKTQYEEHHGVRYSAAAVEGAAHLSFKYLRDRKLPDKAIDVLDEVGASIAMRRKDVADKEEKRRTVTIDDVQRVIAKMARIPSDKVSVSDRDQIQNLELRLKQAVFGQDRAVESVSSAIKLARAGLSEEDKPLGSFLFSGPTGVGKTELAKQLARFLGIDFIRFDMSEYMERHTVSRLIGAPPGYVGFDQGGLLTDAINQSPHAVLLLDEIEKAHPDLHNILLQVMDHGTLTDANGRQSDFRNIILILTTNAGARDLSKGFIGFKRSAADLGDTKAAIKEAFSPEFINRLDSIVYFEHLPKEVILSIVDKFLDQLQDKLKSKKVVLDVDDAARKWLAEKGYDPAYGARPLKRLIHEKVKEPLANQLLFGDLVQGGRALVREEAGQLKVSSFKA